MRSERQKVGLAVCGSVLLHGIALVLFALIVALQPPAPPPETPSADGPMKLEVVDEPSDTPTPSPIEMAEATPTPRSQQVVDATGEDSIDTPSPDAKLSDRTTRASSAEAGEGAQPGAAQRGQRMASFRFDPAPPAKGLLERSTPAPPTGPELPSPDRLARQTAVSTPPPTATPLPSATPAPTAAPDEFALAMATPSPSPEDPFDPSIRSTSPPLPKPAFRPVARSTPTPPIGAARSAENGAGANRGPGGVDTLATPAGRYTRQVTTMIKFIWSRAMDVRTDATFGATIIHCSIDKDGLVIAPRIVSNTSDPTSAAMALQAVVVARLPAMAPDVVEDLAGKRLNLDITFDYLPAPQEAARR